MEQLMEVFNGLPVWAQAVVLVVGLAKLITWWTPTKVDDEWFGKVTPLVNSLLKGLNLGALNVFKDKNKDDKK